MRLLFQPVVLVTGSLIALAVAAAAEIPLFVGQSEGGVPWSAEQRVITTQHEDSEFRVLKNEDFKGYALRYKTPTSCEQGVQYSGYVDNLETDDHYFFYFIESRQSPSTDPLVLWIDGGPGSPSEIGLWIENGPCLVNPSGTGTIYNQYSLNSIANVIYLDQPFNVGYSYGKTNVSSSPEAAKNVYAFLRLFIGEFSQYANNGFHIGGISYAGHYIPAISAEIVRQNRAAEKSGQLVIPFSSIMIGNGWINPGIQFKHFHEYSCVHGSPYTPIFDRKTCQEMLNAYPTCKELIDECYMAPSATTCNRATYYCGNNIWGRISETNLNAYDISKECDKTVAVGMCYSIISAMDKYASREDVRANIGAETEFVLDNDDLHSRFISGGDFISDFSPLVAETLEAGVRVAIYNGDLDYVCNWIGSKEWVLNMNWSGQQGFIEAADEQWITRSSNTYAGDARSYGALTYIRVFGAGHLATYDKPAETLDLMQRWLNHESLTHTSS
ncbi:Alpha/Beta hydrolase protein [Dichotomocladium elegans]|nr:Alpha/Beta hydrolase protein [Dichotomocladium elegans]